MQVAIYARVSTLNQQREGTIASQVRLLKQHIQQQNWSLLPEHEFLNEGISGARLDRPALDRLRDCAGRGEFDAVVILAPDRLAQLCASVVSRRGVREAQHTIGLSAEPLRRQSARKTTDADAGHDRRI